MLNKKDTKSGGKSAEKALFSFDPNISTTQLKIYKILASIDLFLFLVFLVLSFFYNLLSIFFSLFSSFYAFLFSLSIFLLFFISFAFFCIKIIFISSVINIVDNSKFEFTNKEIIWDYKKKYDKSLSINNIPYTFTIPYSQIALINIEKKQKFWNINTILKKEFIIPKIPHLTLIRNLDRKIFIIPRISNEKLAEKIKSYIKIS
ncbi:MAG: hypothetical protein ACFFAO_22120 [Candidatus Hermodarchaeota archaeon]